MVREVSQFTRFVLGQCSHEEVVSKISSLKGSCVLRKGLIRVLDLPSKEAFWLLML